MDNPGELYPVRQDIYPWFGKDISCARLSDGRVVASFRQMCQALKIEVSGQRVKVGERRHP